MGGTATIAVVATLHCATTGASSATMAFVMTEMPQTQSVQSAAGVLTARTAEHVCPTLANLRKRHGRQP